MIRTVLPVGAIVSTLHLKTRPRIVISEHEFPTVGQIAHAQELRGAEVVHVRPDADGSIPPERFAEAIDERTALVCCTTISYRTGLAAALRSLDRARDRALSAGASEDAPAVNRLTEASAAFDRVLIEVATP